MPRYAVWRPDATSHAMSPGATKRSQLSSWTVNKQTCMLPRRDGSTNGNNTGDISRCHSRIPAIGLCCRLRPRPMTPAHRTVPRSAEPVGLPAAEFVPSACLTLGTHAYNNGVLYTSSSAEVRNPIRRGSLAPDVLQCPASRSELQQRAHRLDQPNLFLFAPCLFDLRRSSRWGWVAAGGTRFFFF